jgi:MFS family permease
METIVVSAKGANAARGGADLGAQTSRLGELRGNWSVLLGATLGVALGHALYPLYVMPLLGLQLEHLMGWSREQATSLLTAMSIGNLLGMLCAGAIIDKFGPRWPAVVSTAAIGLLLASAPFLPTSLTAWRVGGFLFSVLGCATGPVAYSRAICDVFFKARGLALGLSLGAIGLAGALMPTVLIALMGKFGVQGGLQALGIGYVVLLAPTVALLLGARAGRTAHASTPLSLDAHADITPISRFRWLSLGFGFFLLTGAGFGAAASIPGLARDTHSGSPVAIMAMLSLTIMVARPISGFLIDLSTAQIVSAAGTALTALGMVLIAMMPHLLPIGAILIGISLGAEIDILAFFVSRYADPARESRNFASIYFLIGLANATMPLAFAHARALTGSYSSILIGAAIATLVAGAVIGTLPRYARRMTRPVMI